MGYVAAWLLAAGLAITVGLAAVSTVGASIRGRGPLGNEVIRDYGDPSQLPAADPDVPLQRALVEDEFGTFEVGCRGAVAYGLEALPDTPAGWRVISYEPGPDDDVDAVFSNRRRSIDLEVFCNRGEPTLAEVERNTLPEND